MKINTIILLLFSAVCAQAQQLRLIQGKTVDAGTKETLPFVNISVQGSSTGTVSGIDGRFQLSVDRNVVLIFSYVGYETRRVTLYRDTVQFLPVYLSEETQQLKTVEVEAGENPAFEIIRRVVKNREQNNPENLESFYYKAYHKFYATVEGAGDLPSDTTRIGEFIRKHHLFLNESYSERKYLKPNLDKETVLGNRMSGVKDPFFAVLATSFQPFSFYKDHITLLERNYVNPISHGSTLRYDFEIADTVVRAADTTFIISFKPLPGKTFDGLEGVLYISTNGYAIEHVLAETSDENALMIIKVQQKYQSINAHWFPYQLNTEFILTENKIAGQNVKYVHRSYLADIHINPPLSKKDFGLLNVEFESSANKKDDQFWTEVRLDSLSGKERNTYQLYDSLDKNNKLSTLNALIKAGEGFAIGRFKAGPFYIPIENILKINKYEDVRFGFGLETGEGISKLFSIGGYAGYGVKDKAVKYGGIFQVNLNRSKDFYVKFLYKQDIEEPGGSNFIKSPPTASGGQALRNWLAFRMDSIQQFKGFVHFRPFKFSQVSLFIQQTSSHPAYTYSYLSDILSQEKFTVTETGLQWRYAFRENYAQFGQHSVVTNYAFPQVNFTMSRAMSDVWSGEFNFIKAEIKIDYQFLTRFLGKTTLQLSGGVLHGEAPYPFLFNGRGSRFDRSLVNGFIVPNYFQTMGLYEFLSDRYAYLFINHNFGRLTGTRSKHFRPELSVIHNMGVGTLEDPEVHQGVVFNTLEKGFYESGVVIMNIVRFKYLNTIYFGLGAGAFYRYGDYSLTPAEQNLSLKVMISASF